MKLNHDDIEALTEPGMYGDGSGLYLQVAKTGTKSWIYRYQIGGKRRMMGLGGFPDVSLSQARKARNDYLKDVRRGIDPLSTKADQKAAAEQAEKERAKRKRIFSKVAAEFIANKSPGWKSPKQALQWTNSLETYAHPVIGNLPVADIHLHYIEEILRPIWLTKTETATRVRSRIEAILDYAKVKKWREGENPARWRGNLDKILLSPDKIRKNIKPRKHHSSLPHKQLRGFLAKLTETGGLAARALELTILCATRTSETLGARWEEFNLDGATWVIPKRRMKAEVEHHVPLSTQAVGLLRKLPADPSGYVFPGQRSGRPLANMAMTMTLRRMGYGYLTVHGFRSTFRTWIEEERHYPTRVAETALAHQLKDKTEAAYNRTNLVDKRGALMQDWANFCYPTENNVVELKKRSGQ